MVKMRCLRAHSSLVWGSPGEGEVFSVNDGYVASLEANGIAERADAPTATPAPAPTSDVDAAVAALHEAPRRRGRRR